jgi:hypothetical protein
MYICGVVSAIAGTVSLENTNVSVFPVEYVYNSNQKFQVEFPLD